MHADTIGWVGRKAKGIPVFRHREGLSDYPTLRNRDSLTEAGDSASGSGLTSLDSDRVTGHSEVRLPLLRQALYDFRTDFCALIVSMEQADISPRPVVGAIVV